VIPLERKQPGGNPRHLNLQEEKSGDDSAQLSALLLSCVEHRGPVPEVMVALRSGSTVAEKGETYESETSW
jgi:hypothetical protein